MAAWRMAKLRVGWIVAGWAPGVRTIANRFWFHWMTGSIGCVAKAGAPLNGTLKAALASANAVTNLVTVMILLFDRSVCYRLLGTYEDALTSLPGSAA